MPSVAGEIGQTGTDSKKTTKEPVFGVATTIPADLAKPSTIETDFDNTIADESVIEEEDVSKYRLSWSPFRIILAGLLVVGVPVAIFAYCGGLRWARRVFSESGPAKGRYKRVADEDLEK